MVDQGDRARENFAVQKSQACHNPWANVDVFIGLDNTNQLLKKAPFSDAIFNSCMGRCPTRCSAELNGHRAAEFETMQGLAGVAVPEWVEPRPATHLQGFIL